jgi:hypothetical protein
MWFIDALQDKTIIPDKFDGVTVRTLEGHMYGGVGDWIIRGTEGELYPCKDVVFQKKYEPL